MDMFVEVSFAGFDDPFVLEVVLIAVVVQFSRDGVKIIGKQMQVDIRALSDMTC